MCGSIPPPRPVSTPSWRGSTSAAGDVVAGSGVRHNWLELMRALESVAHPIRLSVIRRLADGGPASLTELAAAAGVHENTVRSHVAVLETGGVIVSEPRPLDRPGRPGVNYRLADEALLAPSGLAQLLGAALARSGPRPEQLR